MAVEGTVWPTRSVLLKEKSGMRIKTKLGSDTKHEKERAAVNQPLSTFTP